MRVANKDVDDENFMKWLSKIIGKRYENVLKVMQSCQVEERGRKLHC